MAASVVDLDDPDAASAKPFLAHGIMNSATYPYLRITRRPYEEPYHVHLIVAASNGTLRGELEIYANAKDLTDAAGALAGFPRTDADVFLWELGSEVTADNYAFYFRFRAFQVSANGRCAIELRLNNNKRAPHQEVTELCIEAYPADLDRLSRQFEKFSRLEDTTMEWGVKPGT